MHTSIFIWLVYALWLTLVGYLTIAAMGVRQARKENLGQRFAILFLIVASFLLPYLPIFRFVNFAPLGPVLSAVGVMLSVGGMALLVWARHRLGRNWSPTVAQKEGQQLVTSGPYRYVRHPMYFGGLIAAIGSAIVCGGAFVFLSIILGTIFVRRIGAEDRLMAQSFPKEYPDYQKRTKAFIPFVW
jgi:protein-S-isoprenylcysteine O-methyltransferase Ste14